MASHVIDSAYLSDLYGTSEMRAVWNDHNLLQKWLDFEAALAHAEVSAGIVPPKAAEIMRKARAELMDDAAIKRGVDQTAHPLVSLIWQLSEHCEGEAGRYIHWGGPPRT